MTTQHVSHTALTSAQLAQLTVALEEQREFRTEQLIQLAASTLAGTPIDDITETIRHGAEQALLEIQAAQSRLAEGSYGWCATCLAPMPFELLEVLPHVASCVECRRSVHA